MNLITGATGIIGSHTVLRLLQAGKPVIACRQKGSDISKVEKLFSFYQSPDLFEKIQWADVDVCDIFSIEEALEGVHTVYHCAGYVSFNKRDRKKLFKINETGTANVVNACIDKNIVLCHVSSIATINNLDYKSRLTESVFWKTSGRESDYAISKYNAEREVWRGIEEGLKAVIVNPGLVLSPGFWDQSSSRIFSTCYKGNLYYTLGNVGLVSANDVAAAMIQLTEGKHFANRYILIEGNYSFKDLFCQVQRNFGKKEPSINASAGMLKLAWIINAVSSKFTKKEPALTKSIISSALNRQQLSNEKVIQTLGYAFEPIPRVISQICSFYLHDLKKQA
jgi:dihydroflavonol-4-reductase